MNEDKIKIAFEKWAKTKDAPLAKIENNRGKIIYKNWCVQDSFEAWQAALDYACKEQSEMLKVAKKGLDEVEGLTTDDFELGGFLCKELPEGWRDQWILETKNIVRKSLAAIEEMEK